MFGRGRLAAMMFWFLVVVPIAVSFASRHYGARWVLVFVLLAITSVIMALTLTRFWAFRNHEPRELLTAVPGLTAAALLITAPWLAPWALHDLAGRFAPARVIEAEPVIDRSDQDTGRTHYRIADAATERDLGLMWFGPRTRVPVGAVISVSVIPDGWSPPVATERLKDADALATAFAALVAVHVLACAATAAAWPRRVRS
ncbi:hypothetical protein [Streptomyces phaeochromogenes]